MDRVLTSAFTIDELNEMVSKQGRNIREFICTDTSKICSLEQFFSKCSFKDAPLVVPYGFILGRNGSIVLYSVVMVVSTFGQGTLLALPVNNIECICLKPSLVSFDGVFRLQFMPKFSPSIHLRRMHMSDYPYKYKLQAYNSKYDCFEVLTDTNDIKAVGVIPVNYDLKAELLSLLQESKTTRNSISGVNVYVEGNNIIQYARYRCIKVPRGRVPRI